MVRFDQARSRLAVTVTGIVSIAISSCAPTGSYESTVQATGGSDAGSCQGTPCRDADPIRPAPGSFPACAAGQTPVCLGQCAIVTTLGHPCDIDECVPSVMPGGPAVVCPDFEMCTREPPSSESPTGIGRCHETRSDLFTPCDPSVPPGTHGREIMNPQGVVIGQSFGNDCPATLVCVPAACLPTAPAGAPGECANPGVDGTACDSDWTSVRGAEGTSGIIGCHPCAPGLTCSSVNGGTPVCRRSCDGPGGTTAGIDCPAATGNSGIGFTCGSQSVTTVSGATQTDDVCLACANPGAACPVSTSTTLLAGQVSETVTMTPPAWSGAAAIPNRGGVQFGSPVSLQFASGNSSNAGTSGGLCCNAADACANGTCCEPFGAACTTGDECCAATLANPATPPGFVRTNVCTPSGACCLPPGGQGIAGVPVPACHTNADCCPVNLQISPPIAVPGATSPLTLSQGICCADLTNVSPSAPLLLQATVQALCGGTVGPSNTQCAPAACGQSGQACCQTAFATATYCAAGLACVGGSCTNQCGALGQACCDDSNGNQGPCSAGLLCATGSGTCVQNGVLDVADNASETQIAFAPASGPIPAAVIAGYNNGITIGMFNSFSGSFGWSRLVAGSTQITRCEDNNPACGDPAFVAPVACNRGAPPGTRVDLAAPTRYHDHWQCGWFGDPSVVAMGGGQVLYVQLGADDTYPSGPNLVVASVSRDNGATFQKTWMINDTFNPFFDDQPSVAADPVHHQFWVAWRHRGFLDVNRPVMRGMAIDATGTVSPLTAPWDLGTDVPSVIPPTPTSPGISGVEIQVVPAADPAAAVPDAIAIIYGNPDENNAGIDTCPINPGVQTWDFVSTADGGQHWTQNVRVFENDNYFPCVMNNSVYAFARGFAFVHDPSSGNYLFAAPLGHNEIVVAVSTDEGTTWSTPRTFQTLGDAFFPTLAADGAGTVAISFYGADVTNTTAQLFMASTTNGGFTWTTPIAVTAPIVPAQPGGLFSLSDSRAFGDYEGLVGLPPGITFGPTMPGNFVASFTTSFVATVQSIAWAGAEFAP